MSANNECVNSFKTVVRPTLFVAAHLRGMRATSSIDKDIPAINEKLKTQNSNINQTHNLSFVDHFLIIVHIYGYVRNTYP